jgi:hypothetical protein
VVEGAGTTEVEVTIAVLEVVFVVTLLIISVLIIIAVCVSVVLCVATRVLDVPPPEPRYALPTEPTKITHTAITSARSSFRF